MRAFRLPLFPPPSLKHQAPSTATAHHPSAATSLSQKAYADELGIGAAVEWHANAPFSELRQQLAGAVAGLHAMADEHFGISVVEYMAAGVPGWGCRQ